MPGVPRELVLALDVAVSTFRTRRGGTGERDLPRDRHRRQGDRAERWRWPVRHRV